MPDASIQKLTIYTLGRFAVYRGASLIADEAWQRQKAKKIFKLLLLAPQRRLIKDQILDLLWPEMQVETATNNLHRTLFILRRVLQPDLEPSARSHYIWFQDNTLLLNPEAIAWVDVDAFEHLIGLGRQQHHNLDHYCAAIELYKGDLLPEDLYEPWCERPRSLLQQCYTDLLKHVAMVHQEHGAYRQAIDVLNTLLRIEPTNEGVLRDLMLLYSQIGERHQALRLYQQLCLVLGEDLGVEPSAQTTALYQALLHQTLPMTLAPPPLPPPVFASIANDPTHIPLIGRSTEMEQLAQRLRCAQHGRGCVVFLIGEQGVGKTRMGVEVAFCAQALGMGVLHGAAFEGEGNMLYAPFVESLQRGITPSLLPSIRQQLGPLAADLARLLPEIAEHTGDRSGPGAEPGRLDIETGDQERRRLYSAIAATYALFAQQVPLLVFLDNVHVAGESSLQLLHYLARHITSRRILFVCTIDQGKLQRGTPLVRVLGELLRNQLAQRLNLERLNLADVALFCEKLLDGGVGASALPRTIYELSEGNPFFVKELVLALKKNGQLEQRDGSWHLLLDGRTLVPSTVQDVIRVRLDRLSDDAYRALSLAAVIGISFDYKLFQAASLWDRSRLLDALDELVAEALVVESETGSRFRHALIRQVVYDGLPAERRVWLHEQVADALAAQTCQTGSQAAVLAFHYERANRYAAALSYLVRAGDWARDAYALREAREYYHRALDLVEQRPAAADTDIIIGLLERRSQTSLAISDFDAAISDLERLLYTYQECDRQVMAGETLYRIGFAHYWAHRLLKAVLYLDQALKVAEVLDYTELRKRIQRLRDILNSTKGSIADVGPDDSGGENASDSAHVEEHWGRAMLAHLRYDYASAQRHAQTCIAVGEQSANTFLTLGGYFILGMAQTSTGAYQAALDSLLGAIKLSETIGDSFWRARLLNTTGWVYYEIFSLELALQYNLASLELARTNSPRLTEAEGNALANLAAIYVRLGQHDSARTYLSEGLALAGTEPFMRWRYYPRLIVTQGRLALIAGDPVEALSAASHAFELARSTQAPKNMARSCLLRGQALLTLGEVERARKAIQHALTVATRLHAQRLIWSAHLALAELEESANGAAAQEHYQAALAIVQQIAGQLTDPALHQRYLSADPVRSVLEYAKRSPCHANL